VKKNQNQHFPKIPARIVLVAGGIFIAAFIGWLRFILSVLNWNLYEALGVIPGAWYLAVNGLVTGLVYTVAGILTIFPNEKWKKFVSGLLVSGLAVFWIDRICFARSLDAQIALPFSLVLSTGLTLLAFFLLYWPTISSYLRKWKD
jgi:hypothetical protein